MAEETKSNTASPKTKNKKNDTMRVIVPKTKTNNDTRPQHAQNLQKTKKDGVLPSTHDQISSESSTSIFHVVLNMIKKVSSRAATSFGKLMKASKKAYEHFKKAITGSATDVEKNSETITKTIVDLNKKSGKSSTASHSLEKSKEKNKGQSSIFSTLEIIWDTAKYGFCLLAYPLYLGVKKVVGWIKNLFGHPHENKKHESNSVEIIKPTHVTTPVTTNRRELSERHKTHENKNVKRAVIKIKRQVHRSMKSSSNNGNKHQIQVKSKPAVRKKEVKRKPENRSPPHSHKPTKTEEKTKKISSVSKEQPQKIIDLNNISDMQMARILHISQSELETLISHYEKKTKDQSFKKTENGYRASLKSYVKMLIYEKIAPPLKQDEMKRLKAQYLKHYTGELANYAYQIESKKHPWAYRLPALLFLSTTKQTLMRELQDYARLYLTKGKQGIANTWYPHKDSLVKTFQQGMEKLNIPTLKDYIVYNHLFNLIKNNNQHMAKP